MFNFRFQAPAPCQNCRRFHYGYCRDAPRQCWRCNDYNHIERYCPSRRTRWPRNQALPGTRQWCNYHGLDSNPELRTKILNALKASPSCNIYIDDTCIYKGCVEHHFRHEEARGRPLAQRMTRRRSRSPSREKIKRGRSRSPLRQRSPSRMEGQFRPQRQASPTCPFRGRSRSPVQQQRQSPQRVPLRPRGRSPVFDLSGVAKSQTDTVRTGMDIFKPSFPHPQSFPANQIQVLEKQYMQQSTGSVYSFHPTVTSRVPLGATSANAPRQEVFKNISIDEAGTQPHQLATKENLEAQIIEDLFVDDPFFVLGVGEEAFEKEILEAYQQRMWEIERERVADTNYTEAPGPDNVWDQSVAILRAAKKKLVGY